MCVLKVVLARGVIVLKCSQSSTPHFGQCLSEKTAKAKIRAQKYSGLPSEIS